MWESAAATGIVYGIGILEALREASIETHLAVSKAGDMTRAYETALSSQQLPRRADVTHAIGDVRAAIAIGSFRTMGMVIAPRFVKTVAEIANRVTSSFVARAAYVVLKERRRLVLLLRESPLTAIHSRNMLAVTESGGVIAPPVPAFLRSSSDLDDVVEHTVGGVLDLWYRHRLSSLGREVEGGYLRPSRSTF